MAKQIFVNLPVADLERAKAFYEAVGFTNEPNFTDGTAACMVWSETIYVMLLTHAKWAEFTDRPIPDMRSSEVMLAISFDSRDEVDSITEKAGNAGGAADINPKQDHGFMYGRDFLDPDGHVWEAFWMDMSQIPTGDDTSAHERAS